MDIEAYLAERKAIIEDALVEFMPSQEDFPPLIYEAMRYSVNAGGKRIRPILTLASAEATGGTLNQALPIACAIEFIHTYSLIHDDLPCMDDDDLRRGRPTNHKVYGEAMAVLAGDGLQPLAFEIIAREGRASGIPPGRLVDIIQEVAVAAGPKGMVGGQAADVLWEGKAISPRELMKLQEHKTGALLVVSLRTGCMVGGGSREELDVLTFYGSRLGLAFQITDDLLDLSGDVKLMGKRPGSDNKKEKVTFPSLMGAEPSRKMVCELIEEAKDALHIFGDRAQPLREIGDYIIRRDR